MAYAVIELLTLSFELNPAFCKTWVSCSTNRLIIVIFRNKTCLFLYNFHYNNIF